MTAMPAEQLNQSSMILFYADKLRTLRDTKEDLEERLKEVNGQIDEADKQLVQLMLDEEVSKVSYKGKTFHMVTKTFASAQDGQRDALYSWMKDNGYGDLITETVNSQRLSGWVKELKESGDLPEDLQPLVNVYEKTTIGIRSAK